MSFTGKIEAHCPKGCEPFEADVWSFVRGEDIRLRDGLLAGDLNLLSCPECGTIFYSDATVIYYDAPAEFLAFILPASYKEDEKKWRVKVREDFVEMRKVLEKDMPIKTEPMLFFGMESFRDMLQSEDNTEDEVRIAEFICKDLGLAIVPVDRGFARENNLPWSIPCLQAKKQKEVSRAGLIDGLDRLLKANDRLQGYRRWLNRINSSQMLPPIRTTRS